MVLSVPPVPVRAGMDAGIAAASGAGKVQESTDAAQGHTEDTDGSGGTPEVATEGEAETSCTASEGCTQTETDTQTEIKTEIETEINTEINTEIKTETETEIKTETGTEAASGEGTETGTEEAEEGTTAGTDQETAEKTETDTEVESGARDETESDVEDFWGEYPDAEIPFEIDGTDIFAGLRGASLYVNDVSAFPSSFDMRRELPQEMTSVKNQNPWGTCWAFATMELLQNSMIRQGYSDNSIDLSERQLAYFTYNTGYDALDNANDDEIISSPDSTYLRFGGSTGGAAVRLMNWQGGALEEDFPYSNSSVQPEKLNAEKDAQNSSVLAHDIFLIPTKNSGTEDKKSAVKQLILEYGSVAWSYYQSASYYNSSTYAYNCNDRNSTNHAITIVGWDDEFPASGFKEAYRPESDGAWIVKNSWGENWGEDGYFYISYEDTSLGSGNPAAVAVAVPGDTYDNNYFYGNTANSSSFGLIGKAAQIFEIKGNSGAEQLTAVSIMLSGEKAGYSIQVYKNPEMTDGVVSNPESGTKMLTEPCEGITGYPGLYTIDLPEPVEFTKGDYMSIVITLTPKVNIYIDKSNEKTGALSGSETATITYKNEVKAGQSMYFTNSKWVDLADKGYNFRINALTDNLADDSGGFCLVRFFDKENGSLIKERKVKSGRDVPAPESPERKGYRFAGWDKSYENITRDTDIYAQWELNPPKLIPESGIVEEGEKLAISAVLPAEFYYTLDGTFPTPEAGIRYTGPFELTDDSRETTVTAIAVVDGDQSSSTTGVYDYKKTGFALAEHDHTMTAGETYLINILKLPTGQEKADVKWTSSDGQIAQVSREGEITAVAAGTAEITARARDYKGTIVEEVFRLTVVEPVYTVVFCEKNGSPISEPQRVERGKDASPPDAPAIHGYQFTGWSADYKNISGDLTITPEYEPVTYHITYELNGGTNVEGSAQTYTIESDTIMFGEPSKRKSFFEGWYMDAAFSGEAVTELARGSTGDVTLYAKWFTPGGLWIKLPDAGLSGAYTGRAVKPTDFQVYDTDILLTEGVDYTVSYKNNVRAYLYEAAGEEAADNAPAIVIKGKGNYTGNVLEHFTIYPVDIAKDGGIQADDMTVAYQPGKNQTPKTVVTWNGKMLSAQKDYVVEVSGKCSEPGVYPVKIKGTGNFTGERTVQFIIASGDVKPISAVKAAKIKDLPYTGEEISIVESMVNLKDGSYRLREGTDRKSVV